MQVGVHASRRFTGDLDGVFEDTLWDDMTLRGGGRLGPDKHPEILTASLYMLLQAFL